MYGSSLDSVLTFLDPVMWSSSLESLRSLDSVLNLAKI